MNKIIINKDRLIKRIEEIYSCGKMDDGTHTRLAYSDEDKKGREIFSSWAENIGMTKRQDEAGNLIFRYEGRDNDLPAISMGSHLDTVPDGGKYDGVLGCVGPLEVIESLKENNVMTKHPLEIIVFTDEEGARFSKGLTGSSSMCGINLRIKEDDVDKNGITTGKAMENIGIDIENLRKAKRERDEIAAFFELHIEQGSVLYNNQKPIGVVTSIAGVERFEITVIGEANHAGSTMMDDRKDALVAASEVISKIPEITETHSKGYAVATVGSLRVFPSSVNVIPGKCIFTLEIRDQDEEVIKGIEKDIKKLTGEISDKSGTEFTWVRNVEHKPVPMDSKLRDIIKESAGDTGAEYMELPSGAFHDSLLMAERYPTAMIFVPSIKGISHSPEEETSPSDLALGCSVLLESVLSADRQM